MADTTIDAPNSTAPGSNAPSPDNRPNNVVKLKSAKPPRRRDHELEFLPAALELIETPASPAGRFIMMTIVALILIAIAWATLGKVDIIATASGRIIPSGKVKLIQPLEIGVIRQIAVHDGDRVAAGDLLVEMDPTTNEADRDRIARNLMRARIDVARLKSLLSTTSDDPFAGLGDANPADLETARAQRMAQKTELEAKLAGLDRQLEAKRAEQDGVRATIAKLQASLPLIEGRETIREEGAKTAFGSKLLYLQAQQELIEQKNELLVQHHKLDETAGAIAALGQARAQAVSETQHSVLADLSDAEAQVAEQSQELIKTTEKTSLQTLRAPVDGTVQQLAVHTIGGVVTPAEQLMVIVPADATLEIEATIPNKDIGFVHPGQPVEVKIEAFNYTRYGLLHGSVIGVSRDSVMPEQGGRQTQPPAGEDKIGDSANDPSQREPSYVAHIALPATAMETEQGRIDLTPGMAVSAEIKTGRRRVISYLLSPLVRYHHEGMTER